jgi:hypothetical protein
MTEYLRDEYPTPDGSAGQRSGYVHLWIGSRLAGIALAVILAGIFSVPTAAAHPVEEAAGRPVLPGERTLGTEHFLIHYTLSGNQAVSPDDGDSNGVPDYVEQVQETLEETWQFEIDFLGWPAPALDDGEGGDTRIDVYLDELLADGYAGYVDTAGGFLGDNPYTPEQERQAAYGFMVLDDDYSELDPETGESPLGLLQATVAHEFNHLVQAGIDDLDQHAWLYEATASWMEDEVYDDTNDTVFYLDSVFKNPDVCLVAEVARGDDLHWYGNWLLLRHMSEKYGPNAIRTIWINMRQFNGFGAIDATLEMVDSSLEAEMRSYAIANLLRDYEEGTLYPTVNVEDEIGLGVYTPANGVQGLGTDYVRLGGSGTLVVTLTAADMPMTVTAVGIRGATADVIPMQENVLHINRDAYQDAYLAIHSNERTTNDSSCTFADYTLSVEPSSAIQSPSTELSAANFASPFDEPVSVVSGGQGTYRPPDEPYAGSSEATSDTPEGLDVGFDTIIPQILPPGYTFDYAYVMTEEDFGESAIYYVPGGGDTANFDYLDPKGNWLSIAESPSPYDTVQEWLEGIEYYDTPGEIRTINGVDALVEDLSDANDVWISITLILNGLFIVVDGDHNEAETVMLVESLIEASAQQGGTGGLGADFTPIVPDSAPAGYTLDSTYTMTAAELGDSAPYYSPSGEVTINYDYYDTEGHWLSIAESPSPYATLSEWLDDIDYDSPGEFQTLDGVEILVEDLTDSEGPFFSITLILDGLFIVVDNDYRLEDTLEMTRILIETARAAAAPTPAPTSTPPPPVDRPLGGLSSGQDLLLLGGGLCVVGLCLIGLVAVVIGVVSALRKRASS